MENEFPLPAAANPNSPLFAPPDLASFRVAFLTASTWASATATPKELAFAISDWQPGQTVEHALARQRSRRELDRRGLLRKMEREAKAAADDE